MLGTILLAEDDVATSEALQRALRLEGYQVRPVGDGAAALDGSMTDGVDLILLDVMMPARDGLSVCRELRRKGVRTPILMITARTEVSDRVSGLDAGADDYLPKPFALEELLARVRALLRRSSDDEAMVVEDLRIDPPGRRAWRGEVELELTKTEFDLLELLARNAGIVLTHATIYERIWDYDFGPESKSLAVYIGYLRRKTEAGGQPRLIQTIRGVGYTMRRLEG